TRELVELMGGTIGAASVLGQGSTFWFELPLAVDEPPPDAADAAPLAGRVVVIGGREASAALAARAARFGCEARCVATSEAAAELLRQGHGRAALLVAERSPPVDLAALGELLATISPVEPVDIVAVGLEAPGTAALALVQLPADAPDAALRAGLRAALRRPAAVPAPDPAPPAHDLERPRRSLRVLVAEDNRTNQKVIGKMLDRAGHGATIVGSGQEAVDALDEAAFDIVLMDLNMPELGGIEAVKLLRFAHDPEALPPIVALSADATPQTREACRSVGFSAYLTKPVDTELLLRTLEELTGTAGRTAEPREASLAAIVGFSGRWLADAPGSVARESGRPALDRAKLASLAELDRGDGFMDGLIADFVADLGALVGQLERASTEGNVRIFRDQAHALRSSAAHVGATGLFELCLSWRELDDHALMMRAAAELAGLRAEVARVTRELAAFQEDWRRRAAKGASLA
ncbi:MAG TPA: response regulator, partial [Geminicoccaceae bacterium]|nr:response regulator [Geminicoccaceae bacterium]